MAAYPDTNFSQDSQVTPRENVEIDIAADGSVRGRVINASEVYDAVLVHHYKTAAQAEVIEDFYEADRTRQVEVTWRSVQYNLRWTGKPIVEHFQGDKWTVTSRLTGVRSDGN